MDSHKFSLDFIKFQFILTKFDPKSSNLVISLDFLLKNMFFSAFFGSDFAYFVIFKCFHWFLPHQTSRQKYEKPGDQLFLFKFWLFFNGSIFFYSTLASFNRTNNFHFLSNFVKFWQKSSKNNPISRETGRKSPVFHGANNGRTY